MVGQYWVRVAVCVGVACLSSSPVIAETQTLEQALAQAYQTNPGLQAARAKLRAADEHVPQALSGWRPSIDAVAEGGKSWQKSAYDGTPAASGTNIPHDVGLNVTQPIFRGFRTIANVRSAEALVKSQRALLLDAEQQLLLDSAKAYLDVVQAQSVLALNRNNEDVLRQQLEATRDRFAIGELKKTDVSQAESRLSAATAAKILAEGDLANKRVTFARLIGDMPGTLAAPAPQSVAETSQTIDEILSCAETQNPNVVAAHYAKDAARADVTAAEGSLMPEVNLVGNVSRGWDQGSSLPQRQDSASIMAKVTIPIYRSGTDYSRTREAKQTYAQRRLELEDAMHKAHEEALSAWQSLNTSRAAIRANKDAVEATGAALVGVKEEAKAGTRTTLDVLNAEQESLNARVNLVRAEHDEAVAMYQVKTSIGVMTAEALRLPVEIYNPAIYYETVHDTWIGLGSSFDD